MSIDIKYIGYIELDIADTMWRSGLCRAGMRTELSGLARVRICGNGVHSLLDIVLKLQGG